MARWDNDTWAADEYKTSDGRTFTNRLDADSHQDDLERKAADDAKASAERAAEWEARQERLSREVAANRSASENYFNKGTELYHRGDYDGAIAAYNNSLRYTHDPATYDMRGLAYAGKGDFDQAIEDYNFALDHHLSKHNFKEEITYYHRACAYKSKIDYEYAIADYTKTLRLYYSGNGNGIKDAIPGICENLGFMYGEVGDVCVKLGYEELALENYRNGADFGSKYAADKLAKKGVSYTPQSPKEFILAKEAEEKKARKKGAAEKADALALAYAFATIYANASDENGIDGWAFKRASEAHKYFENDPDKAIEVCNTVLDMRLTEAMAISLVHRDLGFIYSYIIGKEKEAVEEFKRAADWDSTSGTVDILAEKYGINYTPGRAKDRDFYFLEKARSLMESAIKYNLDGEYLNSMIISHEALALQVGDKDLIATAYRLLGEGCTHRDDKERALEHYKQAADWGDVKAKEYLAENGVKYKPGKPKDYDRFFLPKGEGAAGSLAPVRNSGSTGTSARIKGFRPAKKSGGTSPSAGSSVAAASGKKGPGFGLSLVLGAIFGFGLAISAGWIYVLVSGARPEAMQALIALAVCVLVSALFIGLKVWKIVIPLALLSAAGWLIQFGVIPQNLLQRTAALQTTSAAGDANTASVTSDGLNLRAEASGGAAVVKTLKKGDTLTVTGEAAEGWTPVEHEGDKGWVSSEYLESN